MDPKDYDVRVKLLSPPQYVMLHQPGTLSDTPLHSRDASATGDMKGCRPFPSCFHHPAQGTTPLHIAAEKQGADTVRLLIDRGAGINLRDRTVRSFTGCTDGLQDAFGAAGAVPRTDINLLVTPSADLCAAIPTDASALGRIRR